MYVGHTSVSITTAHRLFFHFLTFEGEPAGDDIPDLEGDVTGVFLGDRLGDVV